MKCVDMITRELIEYCLRYKKIYCYGAGRFGRETMLFLEQHGIDVEGFLVTSLHNSDSIVLGKKLNLIED